MKLGIADCEDVADLFSDDSFDVVVNLAAQAGVRYSIENPAAYIWTRISTASATY